MATTTGNQPSRRGSAPTPRTGKPGAFIETDLVDPRYFSAANVKNRLESYFQMIEQKRRGASRAA